MCDLVLCVICSCNLHLILPSRPPSSSLLHCVPQSCGQNVLLSSNVRCTWFPPKDFLLLVFLDSGEDASGHLVKILSVVVCCVNLPYHFMAKCTRDIFVTKGSSLLLLAFTCLVLGSYKHANVCLTQFFTVITL